MIEDTGKVKMYSCPICTIPFKSKKMRKQHKKRAHPKCGYCSQRFPQQKQLESHQRKVGHGYCQECDLCFPKHLFLQHVRTVEHAETIQCCDCGRIYFDQKSLHGHCCDCDRVFRSPQGLRSHSKTSRAHKLRASIPRAGVQGTEESQQFHNRAQKHRTGSRKISKKRSRKNKAKKSRSVSCPASEKCTKQFHNPSGLLHHLESGSCLSGMTRHKLESLVIAHDKSHYITAEDTGSCVTSEENFLCGTPSTTLSTDSIMLSLDKWIHVGSLDSGPSNSSTDENQLHSIADENSDSDDEWLIFHSRLPSPSISVRSSAGSTSEVTSSFGTQGEHLRCALCPLAKPRFCNITALLAHRASAAHDSKVFHCPMTFTPERKKAKSHVEQRFSTLGGLAQHVESGACRGHETFRLVYKYVEDQLSLLGLHGVKLLT